MYHILIVDDEPVIARGMQRSLERLELFTVEIAFNGEEALERINGSGVDAMLLDINMPGMSGLELLMRLKETGTVIPTVIISGYEEFEYAQKAMACGAIDYLLKPLSPKNVAAIGMRLFERLESESRIQKEEREIRAFVSSQQDVIKQRLLADILAGSVDPASLPELRRFYGLDLRGEYYTAIVIRITRRDYAMNESEYRQSMEQVRTAIEKAFEEVPEAILFHHEGTGFVMIISATESFDSVLLDMLLQQTVETLGAIHTVEAYIGRGNEVHGLAAVNDSYQSALDALDYRAMFAQERVFTFSDFQRDTSFSMLQRTLTHLDSDLRHMRYDSAGLQLESFKRELACRAAQVDGKQRLFLLNRMMCIVLGAMLENGLMVRELPVNRLVSEEDPGESLLEKLYIWAKSMLEVIRLETTNAYHEDNRSAAHRVYAHIRAHYSEPDLSVNNLSASIGYSPNYLGNAFKREYGDSINDFINQCRVAAAEDLIRHTDRRIYDIAFSVGFSDEHYFSRTFKKYTGKTPSEYRNEENRS